MADITIRGPDCDDGKRGKRGPRGPEGPEGPSTGALLGRQVFNVAGSGTYTPTAGARSAIVRGCGGGGGGGGTGATAGGSAAAPGGNSGVAIETEISMPGDALLTGGAFTVGAGALGMVGDGVPSNGGDSTLLIGGVLLTAPGGVGGGSGGTGSAPPAIFGPSAQTLAVGVDYQSSDLGGSGFALTLDDSGLLGGGGGSGSYGIGGLGQAANAGDGLDASGNGGGGSGASADSADVAHNGGAGSPGIWIIEEYS